MGRSDAVSIEHCYQRQLLELIHNGCHYLESRVPVIPLLGAQGDREDIWMAEDGIATACLSLATLRNDMAEGHRKGCTMFSDYHVGRNALIFQVRSAKTVFWAHAYCFVLPLYASMLLRHGISSKLTHLRGGARNRTTTGA